jgi:hypothetical protein
MKCSSDSQALRPRAFQLNAVRIGCIPPAAHPAPDGEARPTTPICHEIGGGRGGAVPRREPCVPPKVYLQHLKESPAHSFRCFFLNPLSLY